jgi:hypothetical protein
VAGRVVAVTEQPGSGPPDDHTAVGHGDHDGGDDVRTDDDGVDEIGEESFPASDSPSSWSGPSAGPR